ncbi:hypothetical protein P0P54_09595, partial [Campylobacter jejuni]|uniref:hypothetical protein n=1 Tax=Campylobacter jejuni TaxID=197 RepID=UPI002FBE2061
AARRVDEGDRRAAAACRRTRMTAAGLIRLGVVAGLVGLLELLVRGGAISRRVLLPPSEMAADLARLLAQG